jgi:outer membrane cobalamin receptor
MRSVRGRPVATALQACSALVVLLPPAFAPAADTAASDTLDTVVVTGSRIRSEPGATTGPVTVLTKEQLVRGGND